MAAPNFAPRHIVNNWYHLYIGISRYYKSSVDRKIKVDPHEKMTNNERGLLKTLCASSDSLKILSFRGMAQSGINENIIDKKFWSCQDIIDIIDYAKKTLNGEKQVGLTIFIVSHGDYTKCGPCFLGSDLTKILHEDIYNYISDNLEFPCICSIWSCRGTLCSSWETNPEEVSSIRNVLIGDKQDNISLFGRLSSLYNAVPKHTLKTSSKYDNMLYIIENGGPKQSIFGKECGSAVVIGYCYSWLQYIMNIYPKPMKVQELCNETSIYSELTQRWKNKHPLQSTQRIRGAYADNMILINRVNKNVLLNDVVYKELKKWVDDCIELEKTEQKKEEQKRTYYKTEIRSDIKNSTSRTLYKQWNKGSDGYQMAIELILRNVEYTCPWINKHIVYEAIVALRVRDGVPDDIAKFHIDGVAADIAKFHIHSNEFENTFNIIDNVCYQYHEIKNLEQIIFFSSTKKELTDKTKLEYYCKTRTFDEIPNGIRALMIFHSPNYQRKDCMEYTFICVGVESVDKPQMYCVVSNKENEIKVIKFVSQKTDLFISSDDIFGCTMKRNKLYVLCSFDNRYYYRVLIHLINGGPMDNLDDVIQLLQRKNINTNAFSEAIDSKALCEIKEENNNTKESDIEYKDDNKNNVQAEFKTIAFQFSKLQVNQSNNDTDMMDNAFHMVNDRKTSERNIIVPTPIARLTPFTGTIRKRAFQKPTIKKVLKPKEKYMTKFDNVAINISSSVFRWDRYHDQITKLISTKHWKKIKKIANRKYELFQLFFDENRTYRKCRKKMIIYSILLYLWKPNVFLGLIPFCVKGNSNSIFARLLPRKAQICCYVKVGDNICKHEIDSGRAYRYETHLDGGGCLYSDGTASNQLKKIWHFIEVKEENSGI